MKQFIVTILAVMMLLGLTACGSKTGAGKGVNTVIGGGVSEPKAPDDEHRELDEAADTVSVGSVIEFGSYDQDNNSDNGNEPIEWIVLDVKDDKLLLVSKYVLDATQYTYSEYGTTWEESCPQYYLTDTIYTDAFSYLERKKLTTGTIDSEKGRFTSTEAVFALSSDEIEKYAGVVSGLYDCYPTEYAKAEGAVVSSSEETAGKAYWWVRDEKAFGTIMAPSSVAWVSTRYSETVYGVRPAIWVDKDYKTSIDPDVTVSADMVGMWETVSGGDDHYIEISNDGKWTAYDGNDVWTENSVCYSPTEIAVIDPTSGLPGFVFALKNGEIVRYDETGLPDDYRYAKIAVQ